MGYYVNITEANFTIPKQNLEAAYKAMCALNDNDDAKTGGMWGGDSIDRNSPRPEGMTYHPARWFAWMPSNYPEVCPDTKSVLDQLGFDVAVADDGSLSIVGYDSKIGSEELFIEALAAFVADGSFICWRGEDGDEWRHLIKDGKMITQHALKRVWA